MNKDLSYRLSSSFNTGVDGMVPARKQEFQQMESSEKQIAEIVRNMKEMGIDVPKEVTDALAAFDNPAYKVGIIGRFQVGKSHLVNEAFLNQSLLLKEGEGLCTTAVTTEIAFGTEPKLTVIYKDGVAPKVVLNPQAEDIRAATSAENPDERAQLVAKIESVRLEWPCEALRNFTVYDTAGIDDPDPELLRLTTYRTIPQMDAVVMVVGAKALSAGEINFLRKNVFTYGIGRIMVLVSYNPERDTLSESGRAALLDTIRGQLSEVGRENIPIKMVCYGGEDCEDIIHTAIAVRRAVREFAEGAAHANRLAKIKVLLRKILSDRMQDLDFRRLIAEKDAAQIAEIRKRYVDIASEMKVARDEMQDDFDATIHAIRQEQCIRFRSACMEVANRYMKGFEKCGDLGDAQEYLAKMQGLIVSEVEGLSVDRFEDIRNAISRKLEEYSSRIKSVCEKMRLPNGGFTPEIELDGGLYDKINSTVITVADYLVTMLLLPGGIFMSWCLRFLAGRIPVVRRITPSALVKDHYVGTVRASLEVELEKTVDMFRDNIDDALQALKVKIFKIVNADIDGLAQKSASIADVRSADAEAIDAQKIGKEIARCGELLSTV